jgi:dTMP kinase
MRKRFYKGCLITFEGGEGTGKTSLVRDLKAYMNKRGLDPLIVREPGGTKISEQIRNVIKDISNKEMDCKTETLLFQAARAQICKEIIIPALISGRTVIMDRFGDSSIVYQGVARGIGVDRIKDLNDWTTDGLVPDTTFLIDVDPEIGLKRIPYLNNCRLDSEEMSFHQKVRDAYLDLARINEDDRWVIINADRPYPEVLREVINISEVRLTRGCLERPNLGKERL